MLTPPKDSLYHYIKYGIHYVDISSVAIGVPMQSKSPVLPARNRGCDPSVPRKALASGRATP